MNNPLQHEYNFSAGIKTDKNYIVRYNELLNEAKDQFVSDLT